MDQSSAYARSMSELRSTIQRRADAVLLLEQHGDAWLATASRAGEAHLIAVSGAWNGTELVVATRGGSPTARNLDDTGRASVALGSPADVVMLHVLVDGSVPATSGAGEIGAAFREGVGWDPAEEGDDWRYFRLRPTRIQAYRGYSELRGRDVMRDGRWLA